MSKTIFVHDYETFGIDPRSDRVSQFAGIRVDENFNIVEEPVNIYCKPAEDFFPSPEACLITRISPFKALEKGLPENEFFLEVEKELGRSRTCSMGYNTIEFDDEFTRNGFYRNFINPYAREWQNGNSRWDLINVLRVIHAIKPDAFNVPSDENGRPSFRLEKLTEANGIEHENAHDALSDVIGTIEMAKIAKKNAPEIFDVLYKQRQKNSVQALIDSEKPLLVASPFFGHEKNYVEIIYPIGQNSKNKNEYYCIKINHENVSDILNLSTEEINDAIFNRENDKTIPIHKIQINKCPIILPMTFINKEIANRFGFNGELCRENVNLIKNKGKQTFTDKIENVFNMKGFEKFTDPDLMLYNGFFSRNDDMEIQKIRNKKIEELVNHNIPSNIDQRIPDLLFRYIGRNKPELFENDDKVKWNEYCVNRLTKPEFNASLTRDIYYEKLSNISKSDDFSHDLKETLIKDLYKYGEMLDNKFKLILKKNNKKIKP
jgi:exodeoxyribonuclease-1